MEEVQRFHRWELFLKTAPHNSFSSTVSISFFNRFAKEEGSTFSTMAANAHLFDPESDPDADLLDSDDSDSDVQPLRSAQPLGSPAAW